MISVVVGTSDEPERARNWSWVRDRYPVEWEIVEVPTDGEWSKGEQYRLGVHHAHGDVLVVADADCYVAPVVLAKAVACVREGAPWVMPHGRVFRLSNVQSMMIQAQCPPPVPYAVSGRSHEGPRGGGITVLTRAAWDASGGIDPRFCGWGGEDISWARALSTLVGPEVRLWRPMWHFWHEPLPRWPGRRARPENEQLAARYLDADGDPDAMRALVAEVAPPDPCRVRQFVRAGECADGRTGLA